MNPGDDFPPAITEVGYVAPVPRRVRGLIAGRTVLDTTSARYRWDHRWYPAFYVPQADLAEGSVAAERLHREDDLPGMVRIDWTALDAWFEEDEEVFVHPRSPYVRVDALRSNRSIRVECDGVVLADATTCVMVFETGLPTRYYLDRTAVRWEHLEPSETQTPCPYKGTTSAYWSARVGGEVFPDLAWGYDFPTRQLLPIAGLVCFYNEQVDLTVGGEALVRPATKFSV